MAQDNLTTAPNKQAATPERDAFFHALSTYKKVDSGGGHLNNIGEKVADKVAWQKQYKFSIAFENSYKSGYTTEKIYHALCAHTVPIYWGNPRIAEDFNPKRFINCHDYASFDAVIEYVREVDANQDLYTKILAEPWFSHATPPNIADDPRLLNFLRTIMTQDKQISKRTTTYGCTSNYLQNKILLKEKNCIIESIKQKLWYMFKK